MNQMMRPHKSARNWKIPIMARTFRPAFVGPHMIAYMKVAAPA